MVSSRVPGVFTMELARRTSPSRSCRDRKALRQRTSVLSAPSANILQPKQPIAFRFRSDLPMIRTIHRVSRARPGVRFRRRPGQFAASFRESTAYRESGQHGIIRLAQDGLRGGGSKPLTPLAGSGATGCTQPVFRPWLTLHGLSTTRGTRSGHFKHHPVIHDEPFAFARAVVRSGLLPASAHGMFPTALTRLSEASDISGGCMVRSGCGQIHSASGGVDPDETC